MGESWVGMKRAGVGVCPGEGIGLGDLERWTGKRWRAGEAPLMEVGDAAQAGIAIGGIRGGSPVENGKRPSCFDEISGTVLP